MLKYLSRMSSRCTPYGLFAGCSVGSFSDQTQIILDNPTNHQRHTRLDMNYAVALSDKLLEIKQIRECLKFYPNSSIYRIGDKLRYIEYFYKDNIRHYDIVAVDFSEYLEEIITISKRGLYINEIIDNLVEEDIDYEEAKDFVEELIENQILVSEIEPSVSGLEYINQLINVLKDKFESQNEYLTFIDSIEKELESIDQVIGNSLEKYIDISNKIGKKKFLLILNTFFNAI
ncbi:lantibiotic dehydratase [Chryseobacterium sp. 1B4]